MTKAKPAAQPVDDKLDLIRAISVDRALGLDLLFGHRHAHPTPPMHVEMVDLWRSADELVLIEGYRGSAKTTKAQEFLALEALLSNFRYALLICDRYEKACEKLGNIKYELRTNHKINALFGSLMPARHSQEGKDRENLVVLKNGVRIEAIGREQSPRGLLSRSDRPDRAFLDDVETKQDVSSTAAVDATVKWFYSEVLPALDPDRRKVRVNGTPLAMDCFITRLKANPHWTHRSFPIVSGDLDSPDCQALWPQRHSVRWVRAQRDLMAAEGLLTQFMQEYMCVAIDEAERTFDVGLVREVPRLDVDWEPIYVVYDPARTSKKTSNRTGKVVISWQGSTLRVHESRGEFWRPSAILQDIFETNERYSPIAIGVESDSLDEFLREPLRMEMVRRNVSLPLVDLRAPADRTKQDFIKGLQPFCAGEDIVLIGGKKSHLQLVGQMSTFPSKNDDVLNALAYSLRMRPGQPIYEDFGKEHVSAELQAPRSQPVYLAFNASGKEMCCAALCMQGQSILVLEEWVLPGDLTDAVQQVKRACNALFARQRLIAFAPVELFDQWARIPMIRVLKAANVAVSRGTSTQLARGVLSSYIRTHIRGTPALQVAAHCKHVLNALSGGYAVAVSPTGRLAEDAVDNSYRTLIQGVESIVASLNSGIQSQAAAANYALGPDGARYMTSRPDLKAPARTGR